MDSPPKESPKPRRFENHVVVSDSDVESEASAPSERDALLASASSRTRTGRRSRRASDSSAFYQCDDQHGAVGGPDNAKAKRRLYMALALSLTFFVVELVVGILSGSLALLSDSFHLLSDVAGFVISLVALHLAEMPATSRYSYGFHRVEILGAILSTSLIWALTAALVYEAVGRLRNPVDIDGRMMVITAAIGVGVNILLAVILGGHHHGHDHGGHEGHSHGKEAGGYGAIEEGRGHAEDSGHSHGDHAEGEHDHDHAHADGKVDIKASKGHENINVSSAVVHVIGDIVSSVGVLIAGIVIYFYPHMTIVDPICTFLFSVIVLFTTVRIINTTVLVLMESTPHDIDPEQLSNELLAIPGVVSCHDLHLWSLTVGKPAMSVHLGCSSATIEEYNRILSHAQHRVCSRWNIHHTTIQLEAAAAEEDEEGPPGVVRRKTFTAHCAPAVCSPAPAMQGNGSGGRK
ncbi:cation efflux family-domain-containing protein [Hyaloraphidium curvatum]|nr:cation efflux family-domain-containing protein [Hyaloraphidium curvatum]